MNKKTANGFAVLSLLVVLAATASVALRVAAADTAGRRSAAADFERLSALVAPARGAADLADPKLRASLEAHYRSSPSLLLATVYERGAGVRWRIPSRSEYLPAVENARPLPDTRYPPRSSLLLAEPVPGDKSGRLVIEALYATLPQATVFTAFRDATLGIAAYLALAAVAFLVAGLAKGTSGSKARRDRRPETADSAEETSSGDDPGFEYATDAQTSFIDDEACPDEPSLGPGCEPYSPLADEDFAV
ncbi:MAG: hypothetical protein JNG85_09745, partial [Spirochaetaceae bacterium]|nr:hypothetical protein [Spirochaetaceae bacterium]